MLEAVEHVGIAPALGARAHGARIGTGAWLGQPIGREPFARCQPGNPALLLLVGACQEDGQRAELLDAENGRGGGAGCGQLLDGAQDAHLGGAEAAVLLREGHRQDVLPGEQLLHVPGELAGRVYRGGAWCYLLACQLANHLYQQLFVGGHLNRHAYAPLRATRRALTEMEPGAFLNYTCRYEGASNTYHRYLARRSCLVIYWWGTANVCRDVGHRPLFVLLGCWSSKSFRPASLGGMGAIIFQAV